MAVAQIELRRDHSSAVAATVDELRLGIVAYLALVSLALTRALRRRKAALTPVAAARA